MVKCWRCGEERKDLKEGQKYFTCNKCHVRNWIITCFNFPSGRRIVKAGELGITKTKSPWGYAKDGVDE